MWNEPDIMRQSSPGRFIVAGMLAGLALVLMAWTSGCAHTNGVAGGGVEALLPEATSVLTGPAAVLLTNGNACGAEFIMTFPNASPSPLKFSGQMLVSGGKLRLEGTFGKPNRESRRMGDFGLIWNVAAGQGYVFSEALQGYAPINEAIQFTNLVSQVTAAQTERIEGHVVDQVNVTVTDRDGQTTTIQLLRAQDLGNLPLQIHSVDGSHPFALTLSKIQQVTPAEDLFLPPDGFTKYESEAAMLIELTGRQQSILGRHEHDGGDYNPSGIGGRSNTGP
jgi:hypothetical protein